MIIFSELTEKQYDSVEECEEAEREFKEAKEREQAEKEAHDAEVEQAYDDAIKACNKYLELSGVKVVDKTDNSEEDEYEELDKTENSDDWELIDMLIKALFV